MKTELTSEQRITGGTSPRNPPARQPATTPAVLPRITGGDRTKATIEIHEPTTDEYCTRCGWYYTNCKCKPPMEDPHG